MIIFRIKLDFPSGPARYIRTFDASIYPKYIAFTDDAEVLKYCALCEFCFSQDRCFPVLGDFSNLFSLKPPPRLLIDTIGFESREDSLGFSALYDLSETFFWKKILFSIFCFLRGFRFSKSEFPVLKVTSDYYF